MKLEKKFTPILQATLLLALTMPVINAGAEILTITGGSLTQVAPGDNTVQTTIVSQFETQGISSLGGSVSFVDAGNGLVNISNGTLTGGSGTLEVDYLGTNDFFGAFFLSPYSWDLVSGVGTGNFACGDADNGVTCASLNPQQSDWDFTTITGTSFTDSGNGTGSLVLDTTNIRGDTFTWTVTGNLTAVPVPAAAWLFGSGLIGLVGVARRKQALSALPGVAT